MKEQFNLTNKDNKEEGNKDNKEERFKEIEMIAELLTASGSNIKVEYDEEKGWSYNFNTNTIKICPEDMVNKSIEYCKGIISHEASHELISRIDFIPKKEWNEKGFRHLLNAVEDPRVNNWISDKFAGPKKWLKEVYDEDHSKVNKISEDKIGYTPKHIQFGLEVIKSWHTGEFSEDLPEDVQKTLEDTIKIIEVAYNQIPSLDPSQGEITNKAQLMYRLIRGAVWPKYKKIVDESYENAKLDEMIKDMIENGDFEIGEDSQEDGNPVHMDELSEELKEKLKEKIKEKLDEMDSEKKKDLEEKARQKADEKLDELEDDVNEEMEGHFGQQGELREKENKAKSKESIQKDIDRAIQEADDKIDEMRTGYEKIMLDLRLEIDDLTQFFLNEFMSKRQPVKKPASSGADINMAGGGPMKFKATGNYDELFLKTISHEKNDFRVTILVDLSGSMQGENVEETFKGLAMVSEVLNNVGIKFSIYGFQDEVFKFKEFIDKFDDDVRDKMMKMIDMANGGNSDGFCINDVYEKVVLENLSKTNLFMVMSDGEPSGGNLYNNSNSCEEDLIEVVNKVEGNTDIDLIGFGIGPSTKHVKKFYKDNVQAKNVKDIPKKLKEKLKEKIII